MYYILSISLNILFIIIYECNIILCESVTISSSVKPAWNNTLKDDIIIDWLLADIDKSVEGEILNYDGSYNNLNNFNMGSVGEQLETMYPYVIEKSNNISDILNLINFNNCFEMNPNGILYFFLGKQIIFEIMDLNDVNRNSATPFIDGGIIYGNNRYKSLKYRYNGTHIDENGHIISYDLKEKSYDIITASITQIWLLWHNRIATKIKKIRKNVTSEEIFNEARKWTIAVQQSIYMYEWLPFWINMNPNDYTSYNSFLNPQLSDNFNGAIYGLKNVNSTNIKQNNPPVNDLQKLITSISSTRKITGLNLEPFNPSLYSNGALQVLKNGLKEVAEKQCGNGPFFKSHIQDQFLRIRNGDRFWFEDKYNKLFSTDEINKIRSIKFSDIYLSVKNFTLNEIFSHSYSQKLPLYHTQEVIKNVHLITAILIIFIITNLVVLIIPMIIWKYRKHQKRVYITANRIKFRKEAVSTFEEKANPSFSAKEYGGNNKEPREVIVTLKSDEKKIVLKCYSGIIIRIINCNISSNISMPVYIIRDRPISVIKFPHNYDLILIFETFFLRREFLSAFKTFEANTMYQGKQISTDFLWTTAKRTIVSKQHRQNAMEMFFRVAIAQAFKIDHTTDEMLHVGADLANKVVNIELTQYEFADALDINPNSQFVTKIFSLIDRDKKGIISFREYIDLIILFAEGNKEKKAKLLFDMYDIDSTGFLPKAEFSHMLKSFLKNILKSNQEKTMQCIMQSVESKNNEISFEEFKDIIGTNIKYLDYAKLELATTEKDNNEPYILHVRKNLELMCKGNTQNNIEVKAIQKENVSAKPKKYLILQNIETYAAFIFWATFLTLSVLFIFVRNLRFNSYNIIQQNVLSIMCTSSAKSLLFVYAILLITLCQNVWLVLDGPMFRKYFPSNFFPIFHTYFLVLSIFFTAIHIITALVMLFTREGILNYTRIYNNLILYEPQYNGFLVFDLTIITGILLTALSGSTYLFLNLKLIFRNFMLTKFSKISSCLKEYILVIIIVFVFHGSQRKLQNPEFFNYMSGPLILYFIDVFIMLKRKTIDVPVLKAEIHPADVICITIRRPVNFLYVIGQKVRLSLPILSRTTYREFWLSSTPIESNLHIYIPVVDRWSRNLFELFDGTGKKQMIKSVRLRLQGPLGTGIEHWKRCEVAIFIGNTTGISRFASVLKDITHCLKANVPICCKKVYFIWISSSQKQLEWLVDLIYDTENNDQNGFFSCHIFVTEIYEKFNLRTILSFIFEKYYQRVFGKSLFLNLRALTYYTNPHFTEILKNISSMHANAKLFGVFSSGSYAFVNAIGKTCTDLTGCYNKNFQHHPNIV